MKGMIKSSAATQFYPVLKDRRITMLKQSKIQNLTKTVLCIELFCPIENVHCLVYTYTIYLLE
jgi:hypothetical protein